ncbi:SCO2584 family spore wall biosynthesis protein [Streptomyces sp. LE64]|uniref:SCO2584 family spore wall biosynthesis protein n=1 Tax=Streptomyces sp. LE64 TaxID=3448653 RepID=UPI004041A580
MPEDVGGTPPDGGQPDDRDHGGADGEFASVVFDEDFVRAARVREPSAEERLLAAAEARSDAEGRPGSRGAADDFGDEEHALAREVFGQGRDFDPDDRYARDVLEESYGRSDAFMGHARWPRRLAWVLALVMGIGMVALAFAAVYRGAAGGRQDPAPRPSSTEWERSQPARTPGAAASSPPPLVTVPHAP